MRRHHFICQSCSSNYDIWTYNIGMSDVDAEFCCEKCPTVMIVDVYSPVSFQVRKAIFGETGPKNKEEAFSKQEAYRLRLSQLVGPCHCGGNFSHKTLHRCPVCGNGITMDEIKRQINWWGSSDGRPGVVITDCMDQDRRRKQPEENYGSVKS